MKDDNNIMSFKEIVSKWVFCHFGNWGLIIIALFASACFIWWQWDKIKQAPGIEYLIEHLHSVPKADLHRFSILIAKLDHDISREYERLLIESLKGFGGIQVLTLNRTINLDDTIPENAENDGYAQALKYVEISEASGIIWGQILLQDEKRIPKIYFYGSNNYGEIPRRYQSLFIDNAYSALPKMPWDDLIMVLRMLIITESNQDLSDENISFDDRLEYYISRMNVLFNSNVINYNYSAKERMEMQLILAKGLRIFGDQTPDAASIKNAITIYRILSSDAPADTPSEQMAYIRNELANTLVDLSLCPFENKYDNLKDALDMYNCVLKTISRNNHPIEWAKLMFNIAAVQNDIGRIDNDSTYIEQALASLSNARDSISQNIRPSPDYS